MLNETFGNMVKNNFIFLKLQDDLWSLLRLRVSLQTVDFLCGMTSYLLFL